MYKLSKALLDWYDVNKRPLPWRLDHDPYRVWLSEIMLQQTRVDTAIGYFERFIQRWPSVETLAHAHIESVLKEWEGLGYYSRARNLHKAAITVADLLNGRFPDTVKELEQLPGVGPYTARAIASIAFNVPVPAIDGNQVRVLSRLVAWQSPLRSANDLYPIAESHLDRDRPGDQNQAYMDLANILCLPNDPKCVDCPLAPACEAYKKGCPQLFPAKSPKRERSVEDLTVFVVFSGSGGIYVRQRPAQGLLAGIYEFPNLIGRIPLSDAASNLSGLGFCGLDDGIPLPAARHLFTHKVWNMTGYLFRAEGASKDWISVPDFKAIPFPSAFKVYRTIAEGLLR